MLVEEYRLQKRLPHAYESLDISGICVGRTHEYNYVLHPCAPTLIVIYLLLIRNRTGYLCSLTNSRPAFKNLISL